MKPVTIDTAPLEWGSQRQINYVNRRLKAVFDGETLSRVDARQCLLLFLEDQLGEASRTSFSALFAAIMARDEPTVEEVLGFLDVVLWYDRTDRLHVPGSVGIVGSGKDDLKTFNVSTGAALTAASCGVSIVKNGSRSESSVAGTTDVMEFFGVDISPPDVAIERSLNAANITFVDASDTFPRMGDQYIGAFLFLNPLSYILSIASRVEFDSISFGLSTGDLGFTGELLRELGLTPSHVVNGRVGNTDRQFDELSVVGESKIAKVHEDGTDIQTVTPEDLGITRHDPSDIGQGTTTAENARILLSALTGPDSGRGYAPTDEVALNAASALVVGGEVETLEEGLDVAYDAIAADEVIETLYALVDSTGGETDRIKDVVAQL